MSDEIVFVYIPVPDRETGLRLTRGALGARLAACGNLHGPMTSLYEWEGEMCEEEEWALVLKTTRQRIEALSDWIEDSHPYDCPCVLRLEGTANAAFAKWVIQKTG